jgi:hypothetical protein
MKKVASRSAQWPLMAEYAPSFNEWAVDAVDGSKKTFGSTLVASTDPLETGLTGPVANIGFVTAAIPMPVGAVIIGGEVIVDTAYTGTTAATVSVGITGSMTALAATVNVMAAAGTRTALTMTAPMLCNAGQNIMVTLAYTVANATAGKFRVRVQYTVDGRTSEVQIT